MADARTSEIAGRLTVVRDRIAQACAAAGRSPDEVTLIAVTKTYPADDVVRLAGLGVLDVGENRDQEAAGKAGEVAAAGVDVRWHFVGHLQRNKCRSVVEYATVVHSVDSLRLVTALADAADRADRATRPIGVLVQVSLDGDRARGGATEEIPAIAEHVSAAAALELRGVMAVAPTDWDPDQAFSRLRDVSDELRRTYPEAVWISAGMSGDLESAVNHGSTHVRVGTALLGNRPPLR
jgi:pyridoxal phosphate enzyme (YggS family)